MRTFHHSLSLGTGLAVCIGIGSGHAISAPTLEEVVVTAQKREQNLQDVPIAVSAFSGATLEKTQIFDVSDLAGRAPGFVFQQFNPLESELNIRGIGTIRLDSASADSSVVVFLDETYIGRRGAATQDFFDVERIEVLRGPQGTLYGKNVVGGAINIFTGRPEFETSGKLRLGYGNYESKLVSGYFTGGLTETVAGRLSLHYRDRDGYARNHVLGEDLEDYESYAGRGQLLFELSDNLRVHLRADASKDKTNGMNRHEVDDPFRDGIGPVTAWYPPGADIRDNYAPFPQGSERDIWGVSARVEWDTAAATLTSITAYRDADSINAFDQYGADTPPSLLNSLVTESEDYSAISQELRIASSGESAWSWVAGLYLLREETDKDDGQIENSFLWLIDGPGSTGDFLQGEYLYVQSNVTNNYAAFGEVSYQLTDTLKLTAGIRYTVDEKDYENEGIDLSNDGGTRGAAPLAEAFPNQKLNETWKETTPRVVLEWQAADDKMFYASASKGFKGGGWQGKPANAAAAVVAYDPEIAWNYEIGAKTEWLDRALQVNVAAFFIDYQDLQVSQTNLVCLCIVVANAADAESMGIELEIQAVPTENLYFWLSTAIMDTEYKTFIDQRGNDFSGNKLQRTPDYQVNIGAEYTLPLANTGEVALRVDYVWQDEMFWIPANTTFEDDYGQLGARLAFRSNDGRYEVSAWGKNLTDEEFRTRAGPVFGDELSTWAPPRTYGVELVINF